MTQINKNISNTNYMFGDIDNDGVLNIDDKRPLNPRVAIPTTEIKLSDELSKLKHIAFGYSKDTFELAKHFKDKGYKVKKRVKSINSIINKLRRKQLKKVQDIGGIMILTNSPQEANEVANYIESKFNVVKKDDYYNRKRLKSRFYRAYHYTIEKNNKYFEIQIKTKKESRIHLKAHTFYKTGQMTPKMKLEFRKKVLGFRY